MKCGREISLGQVFCKDCLTDMARHPVAPDTPVPVFDPHANASLNLTTAPRKVKPEEQIAKLRKRIKILTIALTATVLVFSILTALLINQLNQKMDAAAPGQNYSTSEDVN
jgi:hypothetical protein